MSYRTTAPGVWTWRRCTKLTSSAAGKIRLQNDDGTIVSIQPDGSEQTRPDGTDGGYEQCEPLDDVVVYAYDGLVAPVVYTVKG
jgi:hypothetical protein